MSFLCRPSRDLHSSSGYHHHHHHHHKNLKKYKICSLHPQQTKLYSQLLGSRFQALSGFGLWRFTSTFRFEKEHHITMRREVAALRFLKRYQKQITPKFLIGTAVWDIRELPSITNHPPSICSILMHVWVLEPSKSKCLLGTPRNHSDISCNGRTVEQLNDFCSQEIHSDPAIPIKSMYGIFN